MLVTNEITQMAKAIATQLPILNGIESSDEHQQALILLEDLIEHYDENLIIIEALSNVIARYEDKATEFDDFNKRQTAINQSNDFNTNSLDRSGPNQYRSGLS